MPRTFTDSTHLPTYRCTYRPTYLPACKTCHPTDLLYLTLHCQHQNKSCIKMGSDEKHFTVSLTVRVKVTRQCLAYYFFRMRRHKPFLFVFIDCAYSLYATQVRKHWLLLFVGIHLAYAVLQQQQQMRSIGWEDCVLLLLVIVFI